MGSGYVSGYEALKEVGSITAVEGDKAAGRKRGVCSLRG